MIMCNIITDILVMDYNEDPILSACLFISAYKLMVGRT